MNGRLFIDTISPDKLLLLSKKTRFKYYKDNYFHFLLNGVRVECLIEDNYYIISLVKGNESRSKLNDLNNFNKNIIFIKDNNNSIYNNSDMNLINFDISLKSYFETHHRSLK